MTTHHIAVIAGDGIGQEVIPEGLKVFRVLQDIVPGLQLEFEAFPWGSDYYREHGVMMPDEALKTLAGFDAIYFGAVGDPPRLPDHITLNGLIFPIRKSFQQYACIRPVKLLPGAPCPLVGKTPVDIDFAVIRENTEGEYADAGGWVVAQTCELLSREFWQGRRVQYTSDRGGQVTDVDRFDSIDVSGKTNTTPTFYKILPEAVEKTVVVRASRSHRGLTGCAAEVNLIAALILVIAAQHKRITVVSETICREANCKYLRSACRY